MLKTNNLNNILNSKKLVERSLTIVKREYRPYDPGNYLYNLLLNNNKNIFSDKYLELIYTTLISWNMNSRGAKLKNINSFKKSILKNRKIISNLKIYTFNDLNKHSKEIFIQLEILYNNLELCIQKSKIVTFSKTMHFLLPKLCIPIDRKYTLRFFYNSTNINYNTQFKRYKQINKYFLEIYNQHNLKQYLDIGKIIWNTTIPKILDNIVIGYMILIDKEEKYENKRF